MGKFAEAMDLAFDATAIFGNRRSKRYALLVEDGKVKEVFVEPDNTGVNGKSNAFRVEFRYAAHCFVCSLTY
jgi:peroxiredoxin